MQEPRKLAGELSKIASLDSTKYDYLEVGYALSEDVLKEVWKCIDTHKDILDCKEFCVIMLMADDNILKNVKRRKFYAWPFLPQPRPRQTVFHYKKSTDDICRLWSLPPAHVMAVISNMTYVDKRWAKSKGWCDAFFAFQFHDHIRKESGVRMLTEKEHVKKLGTDKVMDSAHNDLDALFPQEFDFNKPFEGKVVDSK
jgi:hypothetical protein